jgi:hypothetical protein
VSEPSTTEGEKRLRYFSVSTSLWKKTYGFAVFVAFGEDDNKPCLILHLWAVAIFIGPHLTR